MRSLIFFSANPQETSELLEAAHDDLFCKAVLSDPAELLERLYRDTPDVLLLDLPQDDSSAAELLFAQELLAHVELAEQNLPPQHLEYRLMMTHAVLHDGIIADSSP